MAESELLFCKNKRKFDELSNELDGEGIELSLGLSLNGRFGVDRNRPDSSPLVRSSSVSNFVFGGGYEASGLGRTRSMPAGTEEEWRQRKETQSVRRMEAKRKRAERMKSGQVETARDRVGSEEADGPMWEQQLAIGSRGIGLTRVSDSEPQLTNQEANIPLETRSPGSVQSLPNQNEQRQTVPIVDSKTDKSLTKSTDHEPKEMMKSMMVDMPCVSTRGVGPSGKRVEGFLYQYRKGEEVRIVCVCHGSFLSPAEFVKHAGGGDVSQPLKHIVVNPSPQM